MANKDVMLLQAKRMLKEKNIEEEFLDGAGKETAEKVNLHFLGISKTLCVASLGNKSFNVYWKTLRLRPFHSDQYLHKDELLESQ